MKIIKDRIKISELKDMAKNMFSDFVKAVVDIEQEIMAIEAEFHADLMNVLIEEKNSEPKNLWGINIFPEKQGTDFVVFDSMINLKPGLGNKTRGIEDPAIREKIIAIVDKSVEK